MTRLDMMASDVTLCETGGSSRGERSSRVMQESKQKENIYCNSEIVVARHMANVARG